MNVKKHSKLIVLALAMLLAFALVAAPALAATPTDANANEIGIGILSNPTGAVYETDTIEYIVRVFVPPADGPFLPAQQRDIDVYLELPGGAMTLIDTIEELNPGETWFSDSFYYDVDLGDAVEGTTLVRAFAECFGTAQLADPEDSSATAQVSNNVVVEDLDVSKTVETYFERTHNWEIEKWVETENEHIWDGDEESPKIWLVPDESGDEDATWYVCVTYLGYDDHDFNVSGTITIENTGTAPAVITGVEDLLGGEDISDNIVWDWPEGSDFPYTLAVDATLTGTYDEDGEFQGSNVATVTTERGTYDDTKPIVWEDPDVEYHEDVEVTDTNDGFAEEYGEVWLNAYADVEEGLPVCFNYSDSFAWDDYEAPGPYFIDNTAEVIGDDGVVLDEDDAKLVINWQDESLEVSKTVDTYFEREHDWSIDKYVMTEEGDTIIWEGEETPKIWLSTSTDVEEATWYVCVTYEGYEDSEFEVFGTITITNNGDLDAVIIDIEDRLASNAISVYFDDEYTDEYVGDPIDLAVDDTLTLYYREYVASKITGYNAVTVTTEVRPYGSGDVPIVWGDPDEEYDDVVTIVDDSDLFGEVTLGTLDAADFDEGDEECFTYDEDFAWTDYDEPGPYVYNNTATIVETEQSASAILVINWEDEEPCYADETAWAYGDEYAIENWDYVNNRNWGWTNGPLAEGSYEFDIYAGAGQNELWRGEIVGKLYVDYEDGCVTVKYELDDGYYLGETHLWVGDDVLPKVRRGRTEVYTNAPGQFPYGSYYDFEGGEMESVWTWSKCGFEGDIYVAAHSVVWMEVECPEENDLY